MNMTEKKWDGYTNNCNEQISKERLNLSLPKYLMNYLREESENSYKSVTCVIVEIINFSKYITDATNNGYKLALEDPSGKINYLMFGNLKLKLM